MPLESNELSSETEQVADYHVPNISAELPVDATYKQNFHVNISASGSGGGHSATHNSGDSEEDGDGINDKKVISPTAASNQRQRDSDRTPFICQKNIIYTSDENMCAGFLILNVRAVI